MGASCTKAGREEAAFLKAAKEGDCRAVQQAILRDVEWACKVQTWNGQSVLHLAARYGRLDVLETVVEAVRFNPAGPDKWTKLLRMGHSTDALLRSFANLQDARCQTPLHLACIYGHHEVAERLLQLGATPWAWDELGGRTPLHYAASMGHVDVIRVIVSHNVPAPTGDALRRPNSSRTRLIDICNDSGYTPLHYAVWAGNAASVRALTSYEASLSARNVACGSDWVVSCLKCTPLHLAAHKGNAGIVKLLLSAYVQYQPPQGADAPPITDRRRRDPRRHVNANRQLPYHVAVSRNHQHLSEMLHPDVPFSFILTPGEMESRLYGVPKLAALAARMLQAKLVADIESAVAAMSLLATPAAALNRGSAGPTCQTSGGSLTGGRTRSGALTALSGAVVAAATGQAAAAAGGGAAAAASAAAAAQQVLAAATARLRSVNERSLHGSTAALAALDAAVAQSAAGRIGDTDRVLSNGAPALAATAQPAASPTVVATPVGITTTATAGGATTVPAVLTNGSSATTAVTGGGGGKSTSAPSSDKSSATSATSEKDALAVDPMPDLTARPTPPDDLGAPGNPPPQPPALPLPPAPISPFLPSPSAAAAGGAGEPLGAAGGGTGGRVPTFNEAASAFALFAAEPFDEPAGGGGGGAAAASAGGVGGQALQPSGSASISLAALARNRALQAAGTPLPPAAYNSVSIAVLARGKQQPAGGAGAVGGGATSSNKAAPRRSRSLKALLSGVSKNRRSATASGNTAAGGGPAAAAGPGQGQGQARPSEPSSIEDLLAEADDLDEILNAMAPPPEDRDSVAALAAAAAAADVDGSAVAAAVAMAAAATPRGSVPQVPPAAITAPSRGRGASGGGMRPFWRRSSTQVPPSGDATPSRAGGGGGGVSPYTGSLHAGGAAAAALAASTTTLAASTAPPETLPPPAVRSRAPSLPTAVPPGVIESRASTEVSELDVNVATAGRHAAAAPLRPPSAAGITPIDSVDDEDDSATAPPSSAGTRLRRSSISLAALARGGAEAALPPAPSADQEQVDGAVLAMLASLVEAPQHVLRRYRLLQLTHGLDLQDLLRDHSEQAAAAAGVGVGTTPRASGVVPPSAAAAAATAAAAGGVSLPPSGALPVPSPGPLLANGSLRLTAGAGEINGAVAAAAAVTAAAATGRAASAGSAAGATPADAALVTAAAAPPSGAAATSQFTQDVAALLPGAGSPAQRISAATALNSGGGAAAAGNGSPCSGAAAAAASGGGGTATSIAASANLAGQLLRTLSSAAASESGEGTCGVCFDQPDVLAITRCGHRLCTDCSRELCKLNTFKPALCPFCRGMIGGFRLVGRA